MSILKKQDNYALGQLQALGFADEDDYAQHQAMLQRSEEMAAEHVVIEADGPWCVA